MAKEPDGPAHLYRALNERLQNDDKDAAIELYYELLSSGHSVGEILNGVGPAARGGSKHENAAIAEHPESGPDRVATDPASDMALAEAAPANPRGIRGPNVPRDTERCGTEEPHAEGAPQGGLASDSREQPRRDGLPESEPPIAGSAGVQTPTAWEAREAATDFDDQRRLLSGKFSSIAICIAFWALYTGAVASASIAGFSILRGGRDTEPMIAGVRPHTSSGTEAVAGPGSAGVPETVSATRQEAEAPQPSSAGPPEAVMEATASAAPPRDPVHEPVPSAAQSPSAVPTEAADAAAHPDTGQPKAGETPEATPGDEAKAIAAVPARNMSAALPSRAHAVKRRKASHPRRYVDSRRYVRRRTPARYSQPVSHGRSPGLYETDPARGYGYGAYGPTPYSDSGD